MRRRSDSDDLYFVTLTIVGWVDVFTRSIYKRYLAENISFCQDQKGLDLYKYVIMSNHVHMIARMRDNKRMDNFLRDFKSFTSKGLYDLICNEDVESRKHWMFAVFRSAGMANPDNKDFQIWQIGSHPVILSTNEMIDQKAEYIENNPVKSGFVKAPEAYIYSSACERSPVKCLEL